MITIISTESSKIVPEVNQSTSSFIIYKRMINKASTQVIATKGKRKTLKLHLTAGCINIAATTNVNTSITKRRKKTKLKTDVFSEKNEETILS